MFMMVGAAEDDELGVGFGVDSKVAGMLIPSAP